MKKMLVIIFVIMTSSLISAEKSHQQQHHKKEQLGFFGSRGKRSVNIDPSTTTTAEDSNGDETSLKEWSTLRDSIMGLQRNVRAPKGFFGMRGKKDFELREQEKRSLLGSPALQALRDRNRFLEEPAYQDYQSYLPKRAPAQGFFGMRGKKFGDYDLGGNLNDKRAPKGFMGMRGKKSGPDTFDDEEVDDPQGYEYNYNSLYEKRAPSGFMGMRGKKSVFSE